MAQDIPCHVVLQVEMYADPGARAGVLEPEGMVEIKFKKNDLLALMDRIDPEIAALRERGAPDMHGQISSRQKEMLPIYHQASASLFLCCLALDMGLHLLLLLPAGVLMMQDFTENHHQALLRLKPVGTSSAECVMYLAICRHIKRCLQLCTKAYTFRPGPPGPDEKW